MSTNSPGYAIMVRVELAPESANTALLAAAVSQADGSLTALDVAGTNLVSLLTYS